ncbi:Transcriptional regulator, LysR family [Candidatus Terasakiella magnetica]|uniref:Transcriptional regulator, LysR family n=1 Tax=Candidatus Terasakiella magnetica TaxID=1867952 RepID=A0A1C3RIC7_9PROT|nr:transcriptional regulator GcvA [Candidatus Terasakiella magnetica]SCA57012.1 Transcriptional regulator, LysR family [Candidatus Terasakiella magnetica]
MARQLPPLAQLRSFEAAARFLSFKKAAENLHVTPSAVSHAVQSLEDYLGVKLFHRLASGKRRDKALVLSDAGQVLLPTLMRSFDEIEEAVVSVMAQGAGDILTIATAPIFAKSWLMPRLHRFVNRYPDVDIRVNSTLNPTDSLYGDYDVGLMYGRGSWPGQVAQMLFPETMVPVCSPALIQYEQALDKPQDLTHHTLIHSEARLVTWSMWLENAGVRGINPAKGLHFNRATLAIDAAINGLGVALEGKTAVQDELDRGRLIIPFAAPDLPDQHDGYYLSYPEGRGDVPKVALFRKWVLEEAMQKEGG